MKASQKLGKGESMEQNVVFSTPAWLSCPVCVFDFGNKGRDNICVQQKGSVCLFVSWLLNSGNMQCVSGRSAEVI